MTTEPGPGWVLSYESPAAFQLIGQYLLDHRWHRDGDDPGIWIDPEHPYGGYTLGEALDIQLMRDGVKPETEISS